MVLSFLLFAVAALILLGYPAGQRSGGILFDAAVWCACLVCLILMRRLTYSLRDDLPFVFTSYILFLFLLFFAIERFVGYAALWPQLGWLTHRQGLIEEVSSVATALVAVVVSPHLHGMMDSSVIVQQEHDKFVAAADSSLDDFYIFDGIPDASGEIVDFRFAYINPNAERRLNVSRESLIGKVLTEVRPFMISSGLIENYLDVVKTGVPFTGEVFIDDNMIKATWINLQAVKLGDGLAVTSRDVTERKRLTDRISHLAHHDQLTGLPNRTLLQDRLHTAIIRGRRNHQKVAVFMLDIDNF